MSVTKHRAPLGFAGLDLMGDTLGIDPRLPPEWRSLIRIAGGTVEATLAEGDELEMRTAKHKLTAGAPLRVST
jgi:trehalose/maltose hydrolase-like predicted phosphorylase